MFNSNLLHFCTVGSARERVSFARDLLVKPRPALGEMITNRLRCSTIDETKRRRERGALMQEEKFDFTFAHILAEASFFVDVRVLLYRRIGAEFLPPLGLQSCTEHMQSLSVNRVNIF